MPRNGLTARVNGRAWLGIAGAVALGAAAAAAADFAEPPFHRRARAEARLLPLQPAGNRAIRVDGDLSEWDMPADSFAIHELLDHTVPDFHQSWKESWAAEATDGALIKLLYDSEALYIAVHVGDDSVVSPPEDDRRLHGDVVDIYLDLRPLAGEGPIVGHAPYTEGVYQLVFAPPSSDGAVPIHVLQPPSELFTNWEVGRTVARLGAFEAESKRVEGGYTLEIRLPLASIPHRPSADRLTRPIGFEVMIADRDERTTAGRPERTYYSCSGYSGGGNYFKNASSIACTDPALRTGLPLSRLRRNPLFDAPGGDECEGWIVTAIGETEIDAAFVAAALRSVPGYEPPAAGADAPLVTYPCPGLGLAFHHRRLLSRLPASAPACVGNRYHAVFPAGDGAVTVDGDLGDWPDFAARAATLHQFGGLPNGVTLPDRTDTARLMLTTDGDTLYLALRVRDDSVIAPPGADANRFGGDCVQVFVDVRPPQAKENPLSQGRYTDGAYHFLVAPPTADGQATAFRQGDQAVRAAGPIDVACVAETDGYALEMALPVASLLQPPVPGRFRQFFGFEALVTDVDARGETYAPVVHYSWSGAEEEYILGAAHYFCGAGYVPDRLPEIRALVDASPAAVVVDAARPLGSFSGFGGLYMRDGSLTHTGGRASNYGLGAASTTYIPRHMRYTWARINLHLFDWEWENDNDDPGTTDLTRFKTKAGQPDFKHEEDHGPHYWRQVNRFLEMLQPLAGTNVHLCAYADNLPAWLLDRERKGGNSIPPELWPEYAECVGSFMVFAREKYGIEFDLFALRDPHFGAVPFAPEAYAEVLKRLGAYFADHGLKTKLMLGDTAAPNDFRWYAGMARDPDLLQYIGGVGLETSGPLDPNLANYQLWRDFAAHIDRPLIITGFGRPYVSSPTYLFEEVRIWQQLTTEVRPYAAMIRQFVSERTGNRWPMVHGREIVPDDRRGLPTLRLTRLAEREKDVLPTGRFWIARHFCELTPSGQVVRAESDHPQVLVSAFTGTAPERGPAAFTLHVSNAGPSRACAIRGLPAGVESLHVVRTGGGEAFSRAANVAVRAGRAELILPAWALVSLTTRLPGR